MYLSCMLQLLNLSGVHRTREDTIFNMRRNDNFSETSCTHRMYTPLAVETGSHASEAPGGEQPGQAEEPFSSAAIALPMMQRAVFRAEQVRGVILWCSRMIRMVRIARTRRREIFRWRRSWSQSLPDPNVVGS